MEMAAVPELFRHAELQEAFKSGRELWISVPLPRAGLLSEGEMALGGHFLSLPRAGLLESSRGCAPESEVPEHLCYLRDGKR